MNNNTRFPKTKKAFNVHFISKKRSKNDIELYDIRQVFRLRKTV